MADQSDIVDLDDNRPISLRRKRRSSSAASLPTTISKPKTKTNINPPIPNSNGMNTPPATPQRTKKRVRFSDPGPNLNLSTGLTPFVRRASLSSSPSTSRRHSTPSNSRWNLTIDDSPISGVLQFAPLRQVLEGRVKRRLRRNRLSEEVHLIETEKKCENKTRKTEIDRLREELKQKDVEMQYMRDEQDIASQIGVQLPEGELRGAEEHGKELKIRQLERQIAELKAELHLSEASEGEADWTMAARDPFHESGGEDTFMNNISDEFAVEADMTDVFLSTPGPSRQRSFPSPPSTTPNTPSKPRAEDAEKEELERQLQRLREDVENLYERLAAKLGAFNTRSNGDGEDAFDISDLTALDSALDSLLTTLAVSQSSALESTSRFEALSSELSFLSPASNPDSDYFQGHDPESVIEHLKSEFRTARLELERLLPGETAEGFSPPTAILSVLLVRLRALVSRVQEQDTDIDQYHSLETSLRQQLSSRIDVATALQGSLAQTITSREEAEQRNRELENELSERDQSIAKLTAALQSYRDEVASLEQLITSLEVTHASALLTAQEQSSSALLTAQLEQDTLAAQKEGSDMLLIELEKRLGTAVTQSNEIETQLQTVTGERDKAVKNMKHMNRTQGSALALRDARVTELRSEIERINASLREAHSTILGLRNEKTALVLERDGLVGDKAALEQDKAVLEKRKEALKAQVSAEKQRGRMVIDAMRSQLDRALQTGRGYLDGVVSTRSGVTPSSTPTKTPSLAPTINETLLSVTGAEDGVGEGSAVVVEAPKVRFLDSGLARRSSGKGKKRRRYDSGLGFLEEDDNGEDMLL